MAKHAVLSPSSSGRWLSCPGSVAACEGLENKTSKPAAEGTVAHAIGAALLMGEPLPYAVGQIVEEKGHQIKVDEEMIEHCRTYAEAVLDAAGGAPIMAEQQVPIDHLTGEEGATGTADAIVFREDELQGHDLKYGRGVEVEAKDNTQILMYVLGAVEKYAAAIPDSAKGVRLFIHQPRLGRIKEWFYTWDEVRDWAIRIHDGATATGRPDAPLVPTEAGCKFCPAKAKCPELRKMVDATVTAEFGGDEEDVGALLAKVPMIEDWCKAVRAEVERRLFDGREVPGWKLVQGRKGPRKWAPGAESEVVKLLGEKAYEKVLTTPTAAGKVVKGDAERAKALEALTTQSPGKPSVAPATDARPAISAAADASEFSDTDSDN